jgi:hypothetical protein
MSLRNCPGLPSQPTRKLGMVTLRLYLLVAVGLVIVKVIQLSPAH